MEGFGAYIFAAPETDLAFEGVTFLEFYSLLLAPLDFSRFQHAYNLQIRSFQFFYNLTFE